MKSGLCNMRIVLCSMEDALFDMGVLRKYQCIKDEL